MQNTDAGGYSQAGLYRFKISSMPCEELVKNRIDSNILRSPMWMILGTCNLQLKSHVNVNIIFRPLTSLNLGLGLKSEAMER